MNATWLDPKQPLDPRLTRLLRDLDTILRRLGIAYLLTGGMAREILLYHGYGCAKGRETTDLDFGVTLASWRDYEALRTELEASGLFRPDSKEAQRMIHAPDTGLETRVDLVPFGAIAGPDGALAWPPDGSHVMRVLGYAQALAAAIRLRVDAELWVPLASGPGLAAMKLVAWMDRGGSTFGRDAVDFLELLHQYHHVLADHELYEDHLDAVTRYDFQVEPAASCILGKQMALLADPPLREAIDAALLPDSRRRMLDCFMRERSFGDSGARLREATQLLDAFETGWCGGLTPRS